MEGRLNWTTSDRPGALETGIRSLRPEEVKVVFQPIVDARNGKLFAHEVLVRCSRPEWKAPPALFDTAVAEQACGRLGRQIRTTAFTDCTDAALFINIHPAELNSRWLVQPDDPMNLHERPVYLEITEAAAFTHHDLCRSVLRDLCRRTGALLVIDDFGAGYSNLERVVDLEPSIVKLDLALVRDIHKHRRKQAVVRHVVALCHELGAKVVAEGVEVAEELECVRTLGADLVQGYLLARPSWPPPAIQWPDAPPTTRRTGRPSRRPARK